MKRVIGTAGMAAAFMAVISLAGCQDPGTSPPSRSPGASQQPYQAPIMNLDSDIAMFREAVKVDPNNLNAWVGLGNKLMDGNRWPEAIEAYGKALDLQPENVNVRVDMGTCFRRAGDPRSAVATYRKALEYDPNHVNGNLNLGVVLFNDLHDAPGALQAWEKFLALAPGHPSADVIRNEVSRIRATMPAKG